MNAELMESLKQSKNFSEYLGELANKARAEGKEFKLCKRPI